jgi:predicted DNA-binding transcriptional regulator AlpA
MTKTLNNNAAAAALGISSSTLKLWRHLGKGPKYVKLGQAKQAGIAYVESDVIEWREARTFTSTSAATVHHPDNA